MADGERRITIDVFTEGGRKGAGKDLKVGVEERQLGGGTPLWER
jgi:hypothetical protein